VWERLVEIGSPILGWYILKTFDNITAPFRTSTENEALKNERAADLRDAIVQGKSITLIKSGQALSLRPDLVKSAEYVRELTKLQDEVGTFPNQIAMDIIRSELKREPSDVYCFDPIEPIASASIGQVYKARLVANMSQTVAVKVQRPDALQTAPIDMYLLRNMAAFIKKRKKLRTDLQGIADEFGSQLYNELNYNQEARNCARFKELYGDVPGIYVPSANFDLTTQRVLTMEFVDGIKGPWAKGGEKMLTVGLQCSVVQLLGTGFFHSDPHRGNLLQTSNGDLAYLDFGMMCEVPADRRFALIGTVLGLVNKDIELVITNLKKLQFLPPDTDTQVVVSALSAAVLNSTADGVSGSTLNFTQLNANLEGISYLLPFSLPPFYSLIIRTLTILEGLALSVDPSFRLVRGAYPFIAKQILSSPSQEMSELLYSVMITPQGRIRWDKLEQFITISSNADAALAGDFDALKVAQSRSDLIKTYANNQDSVDITPSIALQVLDFLLSENGKFLREPLLDEVVSILDNLGLTAATVASLLSNGLLPTPPDKPNREVVGNFLGLLQGLVVSSSSNSSTSSTRSGGGGGGDYAPDLAALSAAARRLVSMLQDPQRSSEQLQQLQPVIAKSSVLITQVVSRLAQRNAQRLARSIFTPSRIEKRAFPLLARFIELTTTSSSSTTARNKQ